MAITGQTIEDISFNGRVKTFPSGRVEILAAPAAIFREKGWELADGYKDDDKESELEPDVEGNIIRARRRARSNVHDLAHANDFDLFVTFTLDASRVDRYDVSEVTRKLNRWLDNRVRRHGLRYVMVPELHRDGAIHFHGLVNSGAFELVDSGTLTRGGKPRRPRSKASREAMLQDGWQPVYNLPAWSMGFTTAIRLYGDYEAAVGYVVKYIGKTAEKVGGRWYYSGGELRRPDVVCCDIDFDALCAENPGGVWTTRDGAKFCSVTIS